MIRVFLWTILFFFASSCQIKRFVAHFKQLSLIGVNNKHDYKTYNVILSINFSMDIKDLLTQKHFQIGFSLCTGLLCSNSVVDHLGSLGAVDVSICGIQPFEYQSLSLNGYFLCHAVCVWFYHFFSFLIFCSFCTYFCHFFLCCFNRKLRMVMWVILSFLSTPESLFLIICLEKGPMWPKRVGMSI